MGLTVDELQDLQVHHFLQVENTMTLIKTIHDDCILGEGSVLHMNGMQRVFTNCFGGYKS